MKKLLVATVFLAAVPFAFATDPMGDSTSDKDFSTLDKNQDQYITKEEVTGEKFSQHFSKVDTNMDGRVSEDEYDSYKEASPRDPDAGMPKTQGGLENDSY